MSFHRSTFNGGGGGGVGSAGPAWPFLSPTFPLLLASQLAASPSTAVATVAVSPHSPLIANPLQVLRGKKLTPGGEKRVRSVYIELIVRSGRLLELPNLTIATACVYWHRFFSLHSLLVYHPSLCAAAALFLASKAEEASRRVRDIINVVYRVEHMNSAAYTVTPMNQTGGGGGLGGGASTPLHHLSGAASPARSTASASVGPSENDPLQVSQLFWDLKEEVLRFEQKLLRVLAYEMKVYHPQVYVLHFARELECSEEVCRAAYYICNDSTRTTLCLQYAPNAIACACLYLAAELLAEQIRFHPAIIKETPSVQQQQQTTISAASSSPYRSPHPSSSSSGLLLNSSTSGLTGTSGLAAHSLSSSSADEWWEYFGRVNQLEVEDITHQLLDVMEDAAEEEETAAWMQGRMTPGGVVLSLHVQLQRIAEEEERTFQRANHRQITTASTTATTAAESTPMEDVQATPSSSRTKSQSQTNTSAGGGGGGAGTGTRRLAPSASENLASTVKPPHRLQLGAYASQQQQQLSSTSHPPSTMRSFAMPSFAVAGGLPSYSSTGASASAAISSYQPAMSSAFSGTSMYSSATTTGAGAGAGGGGGGSLPSYYSASTPNAAYSAYAPPTAAGAPTTTTHLLPPSITIAGPR